MQSDKEKLMILLHTAGWDIFSKPVSENVEAIAEHLIKNGVVLLKEPTPPTNLKGKCGSCVFAKPTTFGNSKVYVECTNVEHIGQWCKRQISYKRQRTHKACKRYQERGLTDATQQTNTE